MFRLIILTATALLLGQGVSNAATLEDRGREIASKNCAHCHQIDPTGESKHPVAPPFRVLAQRWPLEQLEEALAEGLVTGHPDMPEFIFQPDDIDALLAYIASISK